MTRGNTMRSQFRLALLAALLSAFAASAASADTIGEKVVKFCKDRVGKKVGDGECASLAFAALEAAGAQTSADYKDSPKRGDYVWGKLAFVREVKESKAGERNVDGLKVRPGDIVQLRDAKFRGKKGKVTYFMEAPHHTAVVVGLRDNGRTLVVLEQNGNGKRYVIEGTYRLDDLKEGWLRVYRPQAK
jgi:hypothetical protein